MSNIINADNGVVSGTPGIKYTADSSGIIQFQSSGNNSLLIDSSRYVSATVNGLGKGMFPAEQLYCLQTGYTGTQATTAQSVFGVGVTLVGSTVYQFELNFFMSKSAGTTAHTISLGFGGTATVNNIAYDGPTQYNTTNLTTGAPAFFYSNTTSATVFTSSITSASTYTFTVMKGIVSINAGGTFIPQYTLSAAPGGAYTTAAGSYFKISPLGASGSNTSIGTWA